jgi:deoxyribose-phosphate aldolase
MIQSNKDLAPYIDHTALKAESTASDIRKLCEEAKLHSFKAVCVNPIFVGLARELLSQDTVGSKAGNGAESKVLIASVIGFPLGASLSRVKALETELAIGDGASEIDMVIRLDLVKSAEWSAVEKDIRQVVQAARGNVVKVILETGLLTEKEIVRACQASESAGAAFVKTATGFLGRGATVEDIVLMRKSVGPSVQIKASGGVKTFAQAKAMIEAGANRIGTSSGVALVSGATAGAGY